jgi:ketosteroid isomerase-like protein
MRSLALIGAVAMVAMSVPPASAVENALDSLVANERAFAALSVSKGMKHAFLTYLAEDAVLFRPRAVNGRKDWEAKPASTATLLWEPSFAAVSSGGDMGYSTGPWEFHPPADSAGTPAPPEYFLYGQFNSVWKKEKGTGWRVVADIGVTHAKPGRGGVGSGEFTPGPTLRPRTMKSGRANIPELDQKLSKAMRSSGARDALAGHAASDLRFNSEGRLPAIGLDAVQARFDTLGGFYEFRTEGSVLARSGDLGYSYGLAEHFLTANAAAADTGVFLHVWRQEGGRLWRLALAVINPLTRR